ncbi:zinc-dependent alcohol dehydrogenase family protein [Pseudonocardia xinjiangensis]|uniref:zinc-dependent alcohol dehydrogenase family protein n=1 Tax=Pseudonocardia xinjiangensis TaxID=75289 RepID=UPI003D94F5C1
MKAFLLEDFGLQNLKLAEVSTPEPGRDELLVKVSAVSLNFRDRAIAEGYYAPEKMPKNLIPTSDASGTVVKTGTGVTRFVTGDRVTSHFTSRWLDGTAERNASDFSLGGPLNGGLAEYMILNQDGAVATPTTLTDQEASTLPIAALTAWFSLIERGGLQPGNTVLVQGTGGVSIAAVQIATALGARVIATSGDEDKSRRVKELGVTDVINYRTTPDWEKAALELTGGLGVDQVLDVVGGESLNRSIRATRPGGHVSVIGFLDGLSAHLDLMPLLFGQTRLTGIATGHRRAFERMNTFIEQRGIKPVIDTVYPFEDSLAAFERVGQGAFGKIVISVS